jgi:hypothetical protein
MTGIPYVPSPIPSRHSDPMGFLCAAFIFAAWIGLYCLATWEPFV